MRTVIDSQVLKPLLLIAFLLSRFGYFFWLLGAIIAQVDEARDILATVVLAHVPVRDTIILLNLYLSRAWFADCLLLALC